MKRVNFPPASGAPSGAVEPVRPVAPSAAVARVSFFRGPGCLRFWALLLAVIALFGFRRALAAEGQQLKGHVPEAIRRLNLQSTGELPATNRLDLAISLPLRHGGDLTNFLQQLYDPASPNYRKFITPDQFAERFGPSQEDYDKLKNFFTTNGLKVTGTHPNRTLLDVNLSVADINKFLHVHILVYKHPAEARGFYAPDSEPSIDTEIPITHVGGLDDYKVPRPAIKMVPPPGGPAQTIKAALGSGPIAGTYFGNDFRDAYAPGVTLDGRGQSLALFELDGYYPSDISNYEALANLPQVPLTNVLVDGFIGAPVTLIGDAEVSMDIELAAAMAPGLKTIYVYEAPDLGIYVADLLNKIATDDLAEQISSSWAIGDDPAWDTIYLQFAAQGQSVFQASGDNGSYNWSNTNQLERADDPNVTVVGGTTLSTTGPDGSWVSETVWNWNVELGANGGPGTNGASGGGISTNYALPVWQRGINMSSNMGSTNFRNIPDVALTADNIYVVYDEGQSVSSGGTSAATPLWAAFCALVNEKAQLTASPQMGFLNPALYAIGKGPLYSQAFHDITNGNNTNSVDPTQFFAVPGYDLCTGWGTPAGQPLIDALVPAVVNVPLLSVVTNIVSGGNGTGTIAPDGCNNLSVLVTNQGIVAATDVQGFLTSLTPGVLVGQGKSSFPNILPGGSAQNQTPYTISVQPTFVCGTTVLLQLVMKCDQIVQTNILQFATGGIGAPVRFDNSTPVSITLEGDSPITVSGISKIGKVTVSVHLTAPIDEYLELWLYSPNYNNYVFLALDDGGMGANFGLSCSPDVSRTTFADDATQSIMTGTAPLVGTYTPFEPLSTFNGLTGADVNGVWELWAYNYMGEATSLQCWSLFISPEACPDGGGQCPGADLSITMSASPVTTPTFHPVTYSLTVSNAGPSPASNTVVNMTLPSGIVYQGAVPSQGTVSQTGSLLTFSLGTVPIQSNATITVTAEAVANGLQTSTAVVGSPAPDPDPDNNEASASVLVTKPMADLAVTMKATPVSVPENGQATFSITVTNNGPAEALGVTVTNALPANVRVVSGSASQGSVSAGGTLASIGNLLPGAGATETLVLSPTALGACTLTSTAGLDPSETDPVQGNNSASVSINVLPAADLGVSVVVLPSPAVSGASIAYVVTVTNAGPATATSVIMNQTLPPAAAFVSTSQSTAVDQNGVVTWILTNDMPGGTSQTLTTTVMAPTLLPGVASNVLVSTFSVFGQPGDPNTNNNFLSVSTLVMRPTEIITPFGDTLTSETYQPPNGAVNPGETVGVQFQLQSVGNIPTTNLVATLQTNGGVIPIAGHGQADYGALAAGGGIGSGQFLFSNTATDGGTVVATLQLQDGQASLGTVSFTFAMPVVSTFWNTNVISIPATNFVATNQAAGPAGPFPSSNLVSGISNYVSGVTVTVSNLEHTYPSDISLWLVGPGGQSAMLMSYAALHSSASVPVTITFDQNAPTPVPATGSLAAGSYQPAAYNSPVFPTNLTDIAPPSNTNLSVFEGLSPNGWWYLYAYDNKAGDYGAVSNGWSVAVTTITPVNPITDLGVTITASATNVAPGGDVSYTITITNLWTNATVMSLTNVLGAGLSFIPNIFPAVTPSQTILTATNQTQIYTNLALAAQTNLTLSFLAVAATNAQTNTVVSAVVNVGSSITDPNTNNNTASALVTVVLQADVAAAISSSAGLNSVVIGSNVTYTLAITNNGPNLAFNVVGLLTQVVTGSTNMVFSNYFGSLAPGSNATVFFTTSAPAAPGSLTNIWTVSTGSHDAYPDNNTATDTLVVTYPEPIMAANGVKLLSENFAPPNGAGSPIEIATIAVTLKNIGAAPATNMTAALLSGNGVFPITAATNCGAISPGASVTANFSFTNIGVLGSPITAVVSLTDNVNQANAYPLGTVSFTFTNSTPFSLSLANTSAIIIPNSSPATPYPSQIAVSATNLVVGQVTVALQGFTHTFPHDVNVLLTSPSGQQTVLMSHVGGPYSVTNLTLAFNNTSTNSLSGASLALATNSPNHPTLIAPLVSYPSISGQPSNTNLSVFNGGNPNGLWSLYVYDDALGNSGSIANGWILGLTLVNPSNSFSLEASNVANNLILTLVGQTGQSYILQVSTNLTTWTSVFTNAAVSPGQFTFTNSVTNAPARFYRALYLSQ